MDSNMTSTQLIVLILAAVVFGAIMGFTLFSVFRRRAWFLWTLVAAAAFQFTGYICLAYQTGHPTDHTAYMASFATTTLAPALIAVTAVFVLGRTLWWITSREGRPLRILWVPSQFIAPALFFLEAVVVACLVFGIVDMSYVHSSKRIKTMQDAEERLAHFQRGLVMLAVGNAVQIAAAGISIMFTISFLSSSSVWQSLVGKGHMLSLRSLLWSINTVMILSFVRSIFKVAEFATHIEGNPLLSDSSAVHLVCDVIPTLVSLLVLCWTFPGAYLPQEATQLIVRRRRKAGVHDLPQHIPYGAENFPQYIPGGYMEEKA